MHKFFHISLLSTAIIVFIWSIFNSFKLSSWCLEASIIILACFIIIKTYKKFTLTDLAYFLIWIHIITALIGAHYTYDKVPFFNWLKTTFELKRNYYDRVVHTIQGVVSTIVLREIFIRKNILNKIKYLSIIVVCLCLSISTFYELGEFVVAKISSNPQSFLATQGDIWDTQWDLTCALTGSIFSFSLNKIHYKSIKKLSKGNKKRKE